MNCASLKSVTIPNSVRVIEEKAFFNCTLLTNVVMSDNLWRIGKSAFAGCSSITHIFIPKGVEEIHSQAFAGVGAPIDVDPCNKFYSSKSGILFNKTQDSLINFPNDPLRHYYRIPTKVMKIEDGAFCGCINLERVDIHRNVTKIGDRAFADCSSLVSVQYPEDERSNINSPKRVIEENEYYSLDNYHIGSEAFANCRSLQNLDIPERAYYIGHNAFTHCSSLKKLFIHRYLHSLCVNAFTGC